MPTWSDLLELLDAPGAYTRGLLAGAPGERKGGREMLEAWGALGENEAGLDWGDIAGGAVDVAVDPLNLIPASWGAKLFSKIRGVNKANKSSKAMRAAGAMPEEIAALTKVVDEAGKPRTMYHGTETAGLEAQNLDPSIVRKYDDPGDNVAGTFFSPSKDVASDYTFDEGGSVIKSFLDFRNPQRSQGTDAALTAEKLAEVLGGGHDALIRSGPHPDLDEYVALSKSQIYSPYVAPLLQQEPSIAPWLAMLLGYEGQKGIPRE
jgi:hypothetical protein